MFKGKLEIKNETGLHARPAAEFTKFVKKYPNDIRLINGDNVINPKSILNILGAGLTKGVIIDVEVEGDQSEQVGKEIIEFVENLRD